MRNWTLGVSVAAMFGMAIVVAAPRETEEKDRTNETLTIRGCVRAGTEPDTFMLMAVTELRPGKVRGQRVEVDAQGRNVLYWLSSTKGLKQQEGRRVEVTGTIDHTDPQQGKTTVSEDSSKRLDSTTEIKSGGQTVTVKTDSEPNVDPTTTKSTLVKSSDSESGRVVYRLKVKSVRRIEGICQ